MYIYIYMTSLSAATFMWKHLCLINKNVMKDFFRPFTYFVVIDKPKMLNNSELFLDAAFVDVRCAVTIVEAATQLKNFAF